MVACRIVGHSAQHFHKASVPAQLQPNQPRTWPQHVLFMPCNGALTLQVSCRLTGDQMGVSRHQLQIHCCWGLTTQASVGGYLRAGADSYQALVA